MQTSEQRVVAVTGATGRQGGAVARSLLAAGWHVRAITRTPRSEKAQELGRLGAEVVRADMSDPASLLRAFTGVHGVFSVQSPAISGAEGERRQGRAVADAAKRAGVAHLVYASAGPGRRGTGVLQWDDKLDIEEYIQREEIPLTILRPMALMELMTDRSFYPAAATWYVMPKLAGATTPIPWVAARDVGAAAAAAFADPDRFVGSELQLAADLKSLDECRAIYREVMGRSPARFPMPVWLLERFAGSDVIRMWRWLRSSSVAVDPAETLALLPQALDVEAWLRSQHMKPGVSADPSSAAQTT